MRSKRQTIALSLAITTMLFLTHSTQQKVTIEEVISQEQVKLEDTKEIITATLPSREINMSDVQVDKLPNQPLSRGGGSGIKKEYNVIISYYTNSVADCGKTDAIGANNKKMKYGYIAMPKEFPFNTKIELEGIGVFENQDRGSAIRKINGDTIKIDMYIPNATRKQLLQMGIKKVKGYILE